MNSMLYSISYLINYVAGVMQYITFELTSRDAGTGYSGGMRRAHEFWVRD